jgi:integrase
MRWEQIDDWVWSPSGSSRNKRQHTIPLPVLVQSIIGPRKKSGFVFPGDKDDRLWIENPKHDKLIKKASGFADYHPHGLRHLAESKCAELKVPTDIRDLLFDHVSGRGSGKIYDHHEYLDEMREAYEKYAKHIQGLTQPRLVVANEVRG